MNIDNEIYKLIDREGGFVNDPFDNGGATKYGITQNTLHLWLGRSVSEDDVRNLDKKTAYEIYYSWHLIKPGFKELPVSIQPIMLDTGVCANIGSHRAIKMLQDALTCHGFDCGKVDGKIGDLTVAASFSAVANMGHNALIRTIANRRVIAYEAICKADETKRRLLSGWVARAESFLPENAEG